MVRWVWTEYTVAKYEPAAAGYRFDDVVETIHPQPRTPAEGGLFEHLLARRHGRAEVFCGAGVAAAARPRGDGAAPGCRAGALLSDSWDLFGDAGMTWEAVSGWIEVA
jgi:hypothetical protein